MRCKVKKLFNGFASVRDHIVKRAIKSNSNLIINYDGENMTIPYSILTNPFQLHKTKFRSRYNGEEYELYDFQFKPDKEDQESLF